MGRNASGVRGINLGEEKGNEVIGMVALEDPSINVMVVAQKGFGKRSELEEYRVTKRGGKGVKTINITDKTGKLIAIKSVTDKNDLMIITKSGITIRLNVADLRVIGRVSQGVKLINLRESDEIAAVNKVDSDESILPAAEVPNIPTVEDGPAPNREDSIDNQTPEI